VPARPVDRDSPLPLWAQVQTDLRRRLARGEFSETFPPEKMICEQYAISRNTVRQALRALRAEGLVIAERGRMPRLPGPAEISQPLGTLYSLFASAEANGIRQSSVVRTLDVRADGLIAVRLGLEESTPLLYLERLRLADEQPLALDRVWLPAELARPLLAADFTHTSLYRELENRTGTRLDGGHEQIEAVVPTPAERALLDCPPHVGAFSIARQASAQGRRVEWRQTLVRGDRFVFRSEFSARAGLQLSLSTRHRADSGPSTTSTAVPLVSTSQGR
jgi:GntR family transcriptional regulator